MTDDQKVIAFRLLVELILLVVALVVFARTRKQKTAIIVIGITVIAIELAMNFGSFLPNLPGGPPGYGP